MKQHNTKASRCNLLQNATPPLAQRLAAIEYRPISDLKPYNRALRNHPETQLAKLEASIRLFGFNNPILVDDDGTIIAGHARLEAAKRAGLLDVPTIRIAHLSKAEVKAFRLAEQRLGELATWDKEALVLEIKEIIALDEVEVDLLGWETAEIDIMLDTTGADEADPADEMPDPPAVPVTRSGDLWLLGKHRLLCGSCLESEIWERLMAGAEAAMSFTDPPYNVPIAGHVSGLGKAQHREFAMGSGEMSEAEFTSFLTAFLEHCSEHLRDGAVLCVCIDWRHAFELQSAARASGLTLLNICVWNKTNAGMGSLYRSKHELVLILKKGKAPHRNNVELGRHGRYRTNVWDYAGANSFGRTRDQDLADHPTVKPVSLVADAIRDVTARGEIIVDPFMGSGTTILAAERTGRIAYGTEIDPAYVDVAVRRWQTMSGQEAVLAETGQTFAAMSASREMDRLDRIENPDISEAA
jgi:DNA modification methylase